MVGALHLKEIFTLVSEIRSALPAGLTEIREAFDGSPLEPLDLPEPSLEHLRSTLLSLNLNSPSVEVISELFERRQKELREVCQQTYAEAVAQLPWSSRYDAAYLRDFGAALGRRYRLKIQDLRSVLLETVQNKLAGFHSHPSRHARGDYDYLSSPESEHGQSQTRRCHNSTAVHILEQAYQYTPNITQAEKYKLAEATGLQPRQVTIWFQNRRNRKGKKEKKAQTREPDVEEGAKDIPLFPTDPDSPCHLSKRKPSPDLGPGFPDFSDAESAASSSASKKPRTTRVSSDESTFSTSTTDSLCTIDSLGSYKAWSVSSVSSACSSISSGTSSSQSEDGHDTTKMPSTNVFRRVDQRPLSLSAKQDMPEITMDMSSASSDHYASPLECSSLANAFKFHPSNTLESPTRGTNFNPVAYYGKGETDDYVLHPENGQARLDLADLQLDSDSLNRALQVGLDQAFDFASLSDPSTFGIAPTAVMGTADDEDDWVDEDDFAQAPVEQAPTTQSTGMPGVESNPTRSQHRSEDITSAQPDCTPRQEPAPLFGTTYGQSSALPVEPAVSVTDPDLFELESFFQFHSEAPLTNSTGSQASDSNGQPCFNFEMDMAELEDMLAVSAGTAQGSLPSDPTQEVYMNFDPTSSMFCTA
nr:homeodomain transcription factor bW [Tranzscheliella williamsii]